jgi:DNA-binding Lrp family transcriptional regulator
MAATATRFMRAGVPDDARFRLLNDFQRDFPLVSRPFAGIAEQTGLDEQAVLDTVSTWLRDGVLSRVGAVFAPRRIGASALAALAAPEDRLEAIAERVNASPEVNHNYQREHAFNLWFVITAESGRRLAEVVDGIETDTGCKVIVLPLEQAFHIDLGFDLGSGCIGGSEALRDKAAADMLEPMGDGACLLPELERGLMAVLERGLPIVSQPFREIGGQVGIREELVLDIIERWVDDGRIKRFGFVVRHHELGFDANAMCVWDVPNDQVAEVGRRLAREPAVTLCYRRSRARPHWPYNLFCMIHGRSREAVLAEREAIVSRCGLAGFDEAVLFSTRRFKQRGSRYFGSTKA